MGLKKLCMSEMFCKKNVKIHLVKPFGANFWYLPQMSTRGLLLNIKNASQVLKYQVPRKFL